MKRAAKKDDNHKAIVMKLESIGAVVIDCSQLKGAFDCLVLYKGECYIVEIKNPKVLPKTYDRDRLEKELKKGDGLEYKCMLKVHSVGVKYHIIAKFEEIENILKNGSTK